MLENETVGWVLLAVVAMIVALLVDHLGFAGREARPVTLGRVLGTGFIFVGLALFLAYR